MGERNSQSEEGSEVKSSKRQAPSTREAPNTKWIADRLPDDEITVLMRLDDPEYPILLGFIDGLLWRSADATPVVGTVKGWMHLEDAAQLLDGGAK